MATTLELFRAFAPDHCEETNGRVNIFIGAAARRLDASTWGAVYPDALVALAAHDLTQSPADGSGGEGGTDGGGPITAKKAGDVAVNFGSSAAASSTTSHTDAELMETKHGRKFLALRDTRAATTPFFATVFE